jgi:hypothetical protein
MREGVPMTEAEWLACDDPQKMLDYLLQDRVSDRKMRLFGVASCRRVWSFLTTPTSREAVEMSERRADDPSFHKKMVSAGRQVQQSPDSELDRNVTTLMEMLRVRSPFGAARECTRVDAWEAATRVTAFVIQFAWPNEQSSKMSLVSFLCEIIGNPFHPPFPMPPDVLSWNNHTVPRIAQTIYEERKLPEGTLDNSRLAILADALLDAGCEDENLIHHCRSEGPHVRGCWAMDLILGKS